MDLSNLFLDNKRQELKSLMLPGNIFAFNDGRYYLILTAVDQTYDAEIACDTGRLVKCDASMIMNIKSGLCFTIEMKNDWFDDKSPACVNAVYHYKWDIAPNKLSELLDRNAYKPVWSRSRGAVE